MSSVVVVSDAADAPVVSEPDIASANNGTPADAVIGQIMTLLSKPTDDAAGIVDMIESIVSPVGSDSTFLTYATDLARVIIKDRNGDQKFSVDDLSLMVKDLGSIAELTKGLVLLIVSMSDINFKYTPGVAELMVLKALMYVFLIIVPKEIGHPLSQDEMRQIASVAVKIYDVILASRVTQKMFNKVVSWFQRRQLCLCCVVQNDTEAVIDANVPPIVMKLDDKIQKNFDLSRAAAR